MNQSENSDNIKESSNHNQYSTGQKSSENIENKNKNLGSSKNLPSKKPASKEKTEFKVSSDELIELHQKICNIDDEKTLYRVFNIIRRNEPSLDLNESSSIDMNDLSMKTRVELFNYFKKIDE